MNNLMASPTISDTGFSALADGFRFWILVPDSRFQLQGRGYGTESWRPPQATPDAFSRFRNGGVVATHAFGFRIRFPDSRISSPEIYKYIKHKSIN